MTQFLVLPAMRFEDSDMASIGAIIEAVRQRGRAFVLITGLIDSPDPSCMCESIDRHCVPSEVTLLRFQEAFLWPMFANGCDRIGFVGLWDALTGCCSNRTVRFESWFDGSGLSVLPARYEIAPEWWVFGRSRQVCRSRGLVPGGASVDIAKRIGASVIVGDTGRLAIGRLRVIRNSGEAVRVGVEAGSLILDKVGQRDRRRRSEFGMARVTVERGGRVAVQVEEL